MRNLILITIIFVSLGALVKAEYIYEEMFKLSWGGDSVQAPYAIDPEGIIHGPIRYYVDNIENIYYCLPYSEYYKSQFRKYNATGELIYNKRINIYKYAVDDLFNVYYTEFNKRYSHILKIIKKDGTLADKRYTLTDGGNNRSIGWIKNVKGKIVYGDGDIATEISNETMVPVNNVSRDPMNSKDLAYLSETDMTMSNLSKKSSYNTKYLNLISYRIANNEIADFDTTRLDICRYPHKAAEVLQIDENDNFYIWVYYGDELPIDLVVLDSSFIEIDRIEFRKPYIESFGIWIQRPIVNPNGNVYEFRALDDGLHVIRWSREE